MVGWPVTGGTNSCSLCRVLRWMRLLLGPQLAGLLPRVQIVCLLLVSWVYETAYGIMVELLELVMGLCLGLRWVCSQWGCYWGHRWCGSCQIHSTSSMAIDEWGWSHVHRVMELFLCL